MFQTKFNIPATSQDYQPYWNALRNLTTLTSGYQLYLPFSLLCKSPPRAADTAYEIDLNFHRVEETVPNIHCKV